MAIPQQQTIMKTRCRPNGT